MKCPSCGATASGKFCSTCGARLGAATCAACGAALSPGAKFCHACGATVGAAAPAAPASHPNLVPWAAAGIAVVALLVVLAVALLRPGARPPAPEAAAPGGPGGPVDLASMSPREAADRLFERVMSADERGDTAEAVRFAPMALQAYGMVGPLDEDARYHIGLISLVLGNLDRAAAEADTIARSSPSHLFAPVLRARVARERGDAAAQRRAEQAFLDAYESEWATNRPEYQLHGALLQQYRQELLAARGDTR
jgi:hypothetical protein